jgi:signal transduction histidine kinase
MDLLALYRSPEALAEVLTAGAQYLAELLQGFALVYREGTDSSDPDGWAGLLSPEDARSAAAALESFRGQVAMSDRGLRVNPPEEPGSVAEKGAGGIYGFPLRYDGQTRGVALVGCPGPWPRPRSPKIEAALRQLSLVLDHYAVRVGAGANKGEADTDEVLQLSEQLLAYEVELKRAEEKMEAVEKGRDDLVEKLSHELRIPVHGMSERVISVLTAEHDALSPSSRQALRQALDDGATFLRTLQHMLDLWRLKQGPVPLEIREINLYEVVEEAIFNVQDRLEPGVEIVRSLPSGLPRIRTDLAKLNQILFSLLDNAVKFTQSGRIELDLQLEEGQLLCTVVDTGIGMTPEDQKRAVEEFFQVDSSADGRHRGAGLGLPLASALVARLGGAVSVTSEVGRGSRFSFTLPVSATGS